MKTKRRVGVAVVLAMAAVTAGCATELRKATVGLEQARESCIHAYHNLCKAHNGKLVDEAAFKKGTELYNDARGLVAKGEDLLAAAAQAGDQGLKAEGTRAAVDQTIAKVRDLASQIEALYPR